MKQTLVKPMALLAATAMIVVGCTTKTEPAVTTDPPTSSEAETPAAEDWAAAEHQWEFAWFGTSTSETTNQMDAGDSLEEGFSLISCTSKDDGSIDKKGGKFAAGEGYDGISFYYTKIDSAKENFLLRADITIDYVNPTPDGQEGVALLVRDSIGETGEASCAFFTNSAAAIATKLNYIAEDGTVSALKDGIGYRMITGVDSAVTPPDGTVLTLDSEAFIPDTTITAGDIYTFELEKTNTGYHASYYNADGEKMEHILYGTDELLKIDQDYVYAGFAVARGCNATFSNITFTTSNPETDAPAVAKPIAELPVSLQVMSAATTGIADYELIWKTNADGSLKVTNETGTVLSEAIAVKAGEQMSESYSLTPGEHNLILSFTPEDGFTPDAGTRLDSYDTAEFEHAVTYRSFEQDTFYVSADGSSDNDGTEAKPVDIATALQYASAGQTVLLKNGTYYVSEGLLIARGINGTKEKPIIMKAEPGTVSFNFQKEGTGFELAGNYWEIHNIAISNTADGCPGMKVSGSHNLLQGLVTHDNGNTGLQISGSSTETIDMWPSYNRIVNCTSTNNSDAAMEDADGFAAKLTCGVGNVFDGCIAAYNADDGWDLFAKIATGPIGSVTIENCVAYKNGYIYNESGELIEAGNGNGFKMGGTGIAGKHVLRNSISYDNKAKGIDSNSCPDIEIYDNISYNNGGANIALYTSNKADTAYIAEGNISFRNEMDAVAEDLQLKGQDEALIFTVTNYLYDETKNEYCNSIGEAVSADWFVSLDTSATPARTSDGSIDMLGLLELKNR
ncbi:MAG: right-handed parallel beta-helix repeat-containing protein [Lachnospiraceae bacterium]